MAGKNYTKTLTYLASQEPSKRRPGNDGKFELQNANFEGLPIGQF
jgi:hypothetical protein